jgi:hypothetical protein
LDFSLSILSTETIFYSSTLQPSGLDMLDIPLFRHQVMKEQASKTKTKRMSWQLLSRSGVAQHHWSMRTALNLSKYVGKSSQVV